MSESVLCVTNVVLANFFPLLWNVSVITRDKLLISELLNYTLGVAIWAFLRFVVSFLGINTRGRAAAQAEAEADDAMSIEVDQHELEVQVARGRAGGVPAGRGRAGRGRGGRGQAARGRGRGRAGAGVQAPGVPQSSMDPFDFTTFLAGITALQIIKCNCRRDR